MMAIFNLDGHFLYHESIQATKEKMNLINWCYMNDIMTLFPKIHPL